MRHRDPAFGREPPPTYAATCRKATADGKTRLEAWAYPLVVGQPLPTIPVWLSPDLHIEVDLEASYEETCRGTPDRVRRPGKSLDLFARSHGLHPKPRFRPLE